MKHHEYVVIISINNKVIDFQRFKSLKEARRFKKMNIKDCKKHGRFDIKFFIDYANKEGVNND